MSAFLFILIAIAAVAIVATLRELPLDGLRPRPADLELLQRLRDREERTALLDAGGPSVLPDADLVRRPGTPRATAPVPEPIDRERLATDEHVAGARRPMRTVRTHQR